MHTELKILVSSIRDSVNIIFYENNAKLQFQNS